MSVIFECRSRTAVVAMLIASVLFSGIGCSKDSIIISPDRSASGSTVLLRVSKDILSDRDEIEVRFGERPGAVVRLIDASTVEVWVPGLEPGPVDVALMYEGRVRAVSRFTVMPPPLKRVFLAIEGDSIAVTDVMPYNGMHDAPPAGGRRISYDVIAEDGRLIYTGAIPYPEGRIEFFPGDQPGRPERRVLPGPVSFSVKIPFVDERVRVRIFSAEPEVDLADEQSRQARKLLREIEIE